MCSSDLITLVLLKEPELTNHQAIEGQLCFIDHRIGLYVTLGRNRYDEQQAHDG